MRSEGTNPTKLRIATQHLAHVRVAYKLLRVLPYDVDATEVAVKCMGRFEVPSQLEGAFQFEDVTGDQYGFDVRYRIKRNMPIPTRPVVPYTAERL